MYFDEFLFWVTTVFKIALFVILVELGRIKASLSSTITPLVASHKVKFIKIYKFGTVRFKNFRDDEFQKPRKFSTRKFLNLTVIELD